MVVDVKPTATLRDCTKYHIGKNYVVVGRVHGDTKDRFEDGRRIHTSKVTSFDEKNQIIHTLNSSYKIENWSEPSTT